LPQFLREIHYLGDCITSIERGDDQAFGLNAPGYNLRLLSCALIMMRADSRLRRGAFPRRAPREF